jgi:hypothetical protein
MGHASRIHPASDSDNRSISEETGLIQISTEPQQKRPGKAKTTLQIVAGLPY